MPPAEPTAPAEAPRGAGVGDETRTALSEHAHRAGVVAGASLPADVGFLLIVHTCGGANETRAAVARSEDTPAELVPAMLRRVADHLEQRAALRARPAGTGEGDHG